MESLHRRTPVRRLGTGAMVCGVFLLMASVTQAQTFSSGSNGSDGAFAPAANVTVALPASGVLHFTTIDIPEGVTVTFTPNESNTPVTLLATDDVTINGVIDIKGTPGTRGSFGGMGGAGGPGGFRGGNGHNIVGITGGAGIGPGGGLDESDNFGGGGSFGSQGVGSSGGLYSSPELLPLIGGSGGAGSDRGTLTGYGGGGGGGGGAILIASSRSITVGVNGRIFANGGAGGQGSNAPAGGGGSGGAIRLVANFTSIKGWVQAPGGTQISTGRGGDGRVRLEGAQVNVAGGSSVIPTPSTGLPTLVSVPNQPTLSVLSVGGVSAPAVPSGGGGGLDITLPPQSGAATIELAGSGIPLGTEIEVTIKPERGAPVSATSTPLAGSVAASTATATATLPEGSSFISASVTITAIGPLAALDSPILIGGEPVETIKLAANYGGGSTLTYITESGKEYRIR